MMVLLRRRAGEGVAPRSSSLSRKELEVPKFIFAATVWLFEPRRQRSDDVSARTRSRDATRRLRTSRAHEPYVDLSPLDLTRRH